MFTGIVEEVGEVVSVDRGPDTARLTVRGPLVTSDARHGDSIAVSGVCLTVVWADGDTFAVDVVHETVRRSSLSGVDVGHRVNLERAAAVGQRLGGHIVQGHVDGTGRLISRDAEGWTRFGVDRTLSRYLVDKGSVTVDGVSLTVAHAGTDEFAVALIPTTLSDTTLGERQAGDLVNLEADVLSKYVERLAGPYLVAYADRQTRDNEVTDRGARRSEESP